MNTCLNCQKPFEILEEEREFRRRVAPQIGGQTFEIPDPKLCPDCRQQRRLSRCNELNLFAGECRMCKKKVLQDVPSDSPHIIYCTHCWWSDQWEPTDTGRDFDFNRPFFDQFFELRLATPIFNLRVGSGNENSDYVSYANTCKNCYLISHANDNEDCYYGYGIKNCKNCVDGYYLFYSELCFDCIDVHNSYGLIGCQDCQNCHSSAFLYDCIGCKNCFGCTGLRQKEYHIFNKPYPKEEYEAFMAKLDLGSHQTYQWAKEKLEGLKATHPRLYRHGRQIENCTGDYLNRCQNAFDCFDCEGVQDARYCTQLVLDAKDVMDVYQFGNKLERAYDTCIAGEAYNIFFADGCTENCSDLIYCMNTFSSQNCFGCANIKRKKYCILNKQYTQEEYETLVPRIIEHMKKTGEWGEFFPSSSAAFPYNLSMAQQYYPLTKEQVEAKGLAWREQENSVNVADALLVSALPDRLQDLTDELARKPILCEVSGRPYRLTGPELAFYRSKNLPIPRRHPDQRHLDRFAKRNPRQLWERPCDSCGTQLRSTYSPQGPEKVYCEPCYLKTVY